MRFAVLAPVLLALSAPDPARAGECPAGSELTATAAAIEPLMEAAESVVPEENAQKLNGRMTPVRAEMGCLAELAPPALAARYHRLRAIQANPLGVMSEEPGVLGALRTAKALDPDYAFPAEMLGAGHAVRLAWESLPADAVRTERVRAPSSGSLAFDGTVGLQRPEDGATLFQRLDQDGAVIETAWVGAGEPLPPYELKPVLRNTLIATAALLGASAGGLYVGAVVSERQLKDGSVHRDLEEIGALRTRTNVMFFSSLGLLAAAGGTAVGAVRVGRR